MSFIGSAAHLGVTRLNKEEKRTQAKSRFIDNRDGTVTDTLTALQWQKEDAGIERDYDDARCYARELRLAGYDDWRLPRKEELMELAELESRTVGEVFPNIRLGGYWAETSYEELYWIHGGAGDVAYTVESDPLSDDYGAADICFRSSDHYVRAVRRVAH